MNFAALVKRMDAFGKALPGVVAGISPEDSRWKPSGAEWSIVEIVNHLADEEVEDFRTRLDLTLHHPGEAWPAIDPVREATRRRYLERELEESVQRFVNERGESVRWLRMLFPPDWSTSYAHPSLGRLEAGSLLGSWAAHDALHLRQIARRMYELTKRDAGEFGISYAGEWKP